MPSFKSVFTLSAAAVLVPLVTAALDVATYPYQPPVSGNDSRGPCPGLNSLANHGILPRDGKNIDLQTLKTAAKTGFNLAEAATAVVAAKAFSGRLSTTGDANTFNLNDLVTHEVIEHDGSMSRDDAYFGNANSFSKAAWDRTLKNWGDTQLITPSVAGRERTARWNWGVANNPDFNTTFGDTPSLLEYALIMAAFTDGSNNGRVDLVKYMFEKESLPLQLGWQPPTTEITIEIAQGIAAEVAKNK